MIGVILAAVVSSSFHLPPIPLTDDELVARHERVCSEDSLGFECARLGRELEVRLYADLHDLQQLQIPIDRELIQTAVAADFPFLVAFGLQLMGEVENDEDESAAISAMDNPSPGVRYSARSLVRNSDRPRLRAILSWEADTPRLPAGTEPSDSEDWATALLPETPHSLEEFGLTPYPGAMFRPSMTSDAQLVFTTSDALDRVMAVVAKGRETVSGAGFIERYVQLGDSDPSAIQDIAMKMQQETDPEKLAELKLKYDKLLQDAMKPVNRLLFNNRYPNARFFETTLPGKLGGKRLVGVARDPQLGTVIAVMP